MELNHDVWQPILETLCIQTKTITTRCGKHWCVLFPQFHTKQWTTPTGAYILFAKPTHSIEPSFKAVNPL